jgi:diguanylate cyclase (GGDEF)-like protein
MKIYNNFGGGYRNMARQLYIIAVTVIICGLAPNRMRILVVEDDELTAQALTAILTVHCYAVEVATTGAAGLALLDSFEYDLLILDVQLPNVDGIEICRRVRALGQQMEHERSGPPLPILMLTGRDSHHDRALGLDAGADDYVVKPFDEEELVARIRALLRRGGSSTTALLEWGELKLNPSTREVTYQAKPLTLTPKEYGLLELFLRNRRRVFSCSSILDHLWTYEDTPGEEAVRTHIKGLRQKIKAVGAPSDLVETVYGVGYRLRLLKDTAPDTSSVATSPEQTVRSKLSNVWQRHQDRISKQITVIEQVTSPPPDATRHQQASQQAHTLAGALGIFGFAEGSRLAKEMEQILATGYPLKAKDLTQLAELLATLRQVIDIPTTHADRPDSDFPTAIDKSDLLLVISRDRAFLQTLESELSLWNYQMTIASTAKSIAKICENDSPKIALIDLECFDSTEAGMTIVSSLQHQSPPIPAIVLTNQTNLTERLAVSRHGGRLLLQKSMPIAQIIESVTQVTQRALPNQFKILVVDDDTMLLEALTTILEPWGLKVFTLSDPHDFLETLEATSPDLLLLDVEFPDVSGIELCQVVRSDQRWSHLPIVVLTAHSESAIVSQAFAVGADDFVSKPIVESELIARILNRLDRVKLLRQLLETDPLTGVANRQKSTHDLETFLRLADRTQSPVAIAVLDVDRLRDVNAKYGHATGDAVLRQFGHLLRQSFCREDVVGRWGGEEFVIGMHGMTREDGVQRLISVLTQMHQTAFATDQGDPLEVTFSAGVAQYPEDGVDVKALYRMADNALRQAKKLRQASSADMVNSILPAEALGQL